MVPSQTRIVIAGITAEGLIRDRSTFWENIYGQSRLNAVVGAALG
jgi:hypothetical protein